MLADEFPSNPFSTLASDFKFLNDGSITSDQLINMQYYYDLFSDIFLAYDEFRNKGIEVIGMCCPDDIFPRHLLLDLAKPDLTTDTSAFRHYFIPSPILCDQYKTVSRLKILFRKLVLLVQKFAVPAPNIKGTNKIEDAGENRPELHEEFVMLREITGDYTVPSDVCESYEAVYSMLFELDKAYSK